uniref:Uncharacterized protein n=1 Tax=Erythrolobus australicus TaxID=1077150 RepID=A0A7S1XI73_9RHOD|mmetsp:Transcript_1739/g.4620  ORF Transcript_1739/g.4620 Transcript_1739/m.4620 type:complete len:319 (+) Transcript_1739:89-1045(+)
MGVVAAQTPSVGRESDAIGVVEREREEIGDRRTTLRERSEARTGDGEEARKVQTRRMEKDAGEYVRNDARASGALRKFRENGAAVALRTGKNVCAASVGYALLCMAVFVYTGTSSGDSEAFGVPSLAGSVLKTASRACMLMYFGSIGFALASAAALFAFVHQSLDSISVLLESLIGAVLGGIIESVSSVAGRGSIDVAEIRARFEREVARLSIFSQDPASRAQQPTWFVRTSERVLRAALRFALRLALGDSALLAAGAMESQSLSADAFLQAAKSAVAARMLDPARLYLYIASSCAFIVAIALSAAPFFVRKMVHIVI